MMESSFSAIGFSGFSVDGSSFNSSFSPIRSAADSKIDQFVSSPSEDGQKKLVVYEGSLTKESPPGLFQRIGGCFQNQIVKISSLLLGVFASSKSQVFDISSICLNLKINPINAGVLQKMFPQEAQEITDFITKSWLTPFFKCTQEEKSFVYSLATSTKRSFFVKYRLWNQRFQILIWEYGGKGGYKIFQKVVIVYGPPVLDELGFDFARLKIKKENKAKEWVQNVFRFESDLSRQLSLDGVKHIVRYFLISRKPGGVTLGSTLYKEDLFKYLCRYSKKNLTSSYVQKSLLNIAIPMAEALSGMHKRGFAHLDFKPENIFLSGSGEAFLGDFGTCRRISQKEQKGIVTHIISPPEILENPDSVMIVDSSFDVWAFGLFLVSMFWGLKHARCFYSADFDSLPQKDQLARIKMGVGSLVIQIEKLSQLSEYAVPKNVCELIVRLLSLDPQKRPTAADSLRILQEALTQV